MSHINTSASSVCWHACGLHPSQMSASHLFFPLWWKECLSYLLCATAFLRPPLPKQKPFFIPARTHHPPPPTYLSFLFCPFCFPAKLLNSSSVGCWYHRRLRTKKRTETWNQAQKWTGGKSKKGDATKQIFRAQTYLSSLYIIKIYSIK